VSNVITFDRGRNHASGILVQRLQPAAANNSARRHYAPFVSLSHRWSVKNSWSY